MGYILEELTGNRGNSVLRTVFNPNQKTRTLTKKIVPKMITFPYLRFQIANDFANFNGSSVHVFADSDI